MGIIDRIRLKFSNKKKFSPFYTKEHFPNEKFIIGEYSYGKPNILFNNADSNLFIGKYCSIAEGVNIFLGGNHRLDWITTYPFNSIPKEEFYEFHKIQGHPATKGNVIIGNDVWIGRNATIMSGITIDDGAVIAAESVVTNNIGAYEIWGGNPAKLLKKRFDEDTVDKLIKLKWWNLPPDKVREVVPLLMSSNFNDLFNAIK